jgi:hypothetical protein
MNTHSYKERIGKIMMIILGLVFLLAGGGLLA